MSDQQFSTRVLTKYPPYYPQRLVAETQLIIAEAVRKFPTLDLILPLCQYVVARMTPVMMRETSGVRPDLAFMHMDNLVEYILIDHFLHSPDARFDLRQAIVKSEEWQALAKTVADKCAVPQPEKPQQESAPIPPIAAPRESIQVDNTAAVYVFAQEARQARKRKRKPARTRVQEPAPASSAEPAADKAATESESVIEAAQPVDPAQAPDAGQIDQPAPDKAATESESVTETVQPIEPAQETVAAEMNRSERVDAFLRRMSEALNREITRTHLWKAAEYTEATPFERWQRNDPRASKRASRKIEGRLKIESPDEFRRFLPDEVLYELKLK